MGTIWYWISGPVTVIGLADHSTIGLHSTILMAEVSIIRIPTLIVKIVSDSRIRFVLLAINELKSKKYRFEIEKSVFWWEVKVGKTSFKGHSQVLSKNVFVSLLYYTCDVTLI